MARQSRDPVILLTRPLAQGQRFAAELAKAIGEQPPILLAPLMAPEFLTVELPARRYAGIILSSETGAAAARALRTALPDQAFCVGDRTAQSASDAGFAAVSAKGDAESLVALLLSLRPAGPLLHLRGEETRGDIAETLTKGGIETDSIVVYAQRPQPLTSPAIAALRGGGPVILPLFSPRSADLVARVLPKPPAAPLWIAAISPAVADAARQLSPARMVVADRPDAPAMICAVQRLVAAGMTS